MEQWFPKQSYKMMNVFKIYLLVVLSVPSIGWAQQPATDLSEYAKKYPDSRGVMLENSRKAKISVKKDKIQILLTDVKSYFILSDKPDAFAEEEIYFSEQLNLVDFKAYSMVPNGEKYKKVEVTNFQDSYESDDMIFYDENKKRTYLFPSLTQGSKTYAEHTLKIDEPRFFGKFFFENYLPTENSNFEIEAPADVELSIHKLGKNTDKIEYTQTKSGKNIIHRWSMKTVPSLKMQDDDAPLGYFSPHVIVTIKRYKSSDGKTVEVTPDLPALFRYYSSLIDKVDLTVSPEIKQISDSVTQGKSSEKERLKAIYYWVQDNIKYIAFEHGMEGLIPRDPNKIMSKRYGDCKDMAILIYTMAKSVNIPVHPTWIGTRDLPYRYDEIPSLQVDNHMIVTYFDADKKAYFLDGTSNYLDFNIPSAFTQGKQALIYMNKNEYELRMVPEVEASENTALDSVNLVLKGDSIMGEGVVKFSGYIRQMVARNLAGASEENIQYVLSVFTRKGNNKYKLDTAFYNTTNRDTSLIIHYRFVIRDYVTTSGDEVYINLNLDKDLKEKKIDIENALHPIFESMKISMRAKYTLTIPDGYKLDYIPENYQYGNKQVSASGEYQKTDNAVSLVFKSNLNYLLLATEDFADFNGVIKKVNQAFNQSISLKKIKK